MSTHGESKDSVSKILIMQEHLIHESNHSHLISNYNVITVIEAVNKAWMEQSVDILTSNNY